MDIIPTPEFLEACRQVLGRDDLATIVTAMRDGDPRMDTVRDVHRDILRAKESQLPLRERRAASSDIIEQAGRIIASEMAALYPGTGLTFGIQVSFELDKLLPGASAEAVTIIATRKKRKSKRADDRRVICELRKPARGGGQ